MRPQEHAPPATPQERAVVVSKATVRAAERLGLTSALLARVVGLSEATVSRLRRGDYVLPPASKEYELALLFLRLFRSLDALLGGDEPAARSWMRTENTALRARPVDLITSVQGLVETVSYVDARRAPL
ncbi:antitoxin Xre/MbcA/ParS toxin-binding domain-containing protein [Novispirillum sp. DQ9]|uniref:antitoxin Xre/MbcA/ParS toxin-binding domain-containing protein n=1 Tax=Novispirillum sp. DQ9 TaxID=3398612 RepID=UPI003C7B25BC